MPPTTDGQEIASYGSKSGPPPTDSRIMVPTMHHTIRDRLLDALQRMPEGVRRHVEEVRAASVELAERHGLNVAKAELAALGHDVCRVTPPQELLRLARGFGLLLTPIDEAFPVFIHGPVGAEVLQRDYGIDDEAILDPVRYHTMGRGGMTASDKVLFLADKLDPSKLRRYPFIAEVKQLALKDLDRGMLCFIDNQVKAFIGHGDLVHPGMMAARNDALLALRRRD